MVQTTADTTTDNYDRLTWPQRIWRIGAMAFFSFSDHNCSRMAAALSYYMMFSLPGLLVVMISLVGIFINSQQAQDRVSAEIRSFVGQEGAALVETMIEHVRTTRQSGGGAFLGIAVLLIGTTGVVVELQNSLNDIWDVKPRTDVSFIRYFVKTRLVSLILILSGALLLLVSLVIETALAAFGQRFAVWFSALPSARSLSWLNGIVTFSILSLLLGTIFKALPETKIRWRDVWSSAIVTAALFGIGRHLLSLYFTYMDVASGYGAAGSLALILVWIYYSSMILLLGAELSKAWAERHIRSARTLREPDHG